MSPDAYQACGVDTLTGRGAGYSNRQFAWALFNGPHGLAASPDGAAVFVADTANNLVRRLDMGSRT